MVASSPTRKQKQSLGWDYHLLFTRFCELASTPNHPALAHIPPPTSFPQTQWLLNSESKQKVWMKENMMGGIEMLTHALDQDWPEWAANSTNVLGLLLSDLFRDFYPWLAKLPAHQISCSTLLRFERHMFNQAQLRHTWEWWRQNRQISPGTCFRPSLSGKNEKVVMARHAVNTKTRVTYTWRAYWEAEWKECSEAEVTEDDWVMLE
ncbi:hypothetical protein BN14_09285 [Rhizoctonia solani AG-1 IB]|uniref:Uncharacterized protein n=1 Tax=Thanatephorus cucumeris (strain AG1-IB / isolate 7/3/14) TaxID=1108050 RepID=M5C7Z1_THACB|nr:hypothetical protein BN14_09285 [Rhizoctonia solani AG-1 IB]